MRLSLMHKGFLLVSIPLCFELVIFSMLLSLQNDMAQESARINRSRMIGDTVSKIGRQTVILEDVFRHCNDPVVVARNIRVGIDELTTQFQKLDQLTERDTALHALVIKSMQQLDMAKVELETLKEHLMEDTRADPTLQAKSFGPRFHYRLRAAVSAGLLELAANSAKEIDTDRTTTMRNQVTMLLKIAVAISALVATIGAWTFSRHMISRLKTVVGNAERLGHRKPLSAPVGGNDEIGELDTALHNAADLITKLEQGREEIIGMVSHDIRSPLSTIKASGDLLEDKLRDKLDERAIELIGAIRTNCDKVLRISKDLLDMHRLEAGMLVLDKAPTNLKECLLSAASATEGLQRSLGVDVEPVLAPLHATVDEGRIEQVVTNLLTNAIKYSPPGSKVILNLEETPDSEIRISVVDHGDGVPEAMKKTIFDRFKQINKEDAKKGSGLGLAISKALVELHGGKIGVRDATPKGSEFWVSLPNVHKKV